MAVKTDGGNEYPSAAYLVVPEPDNPSSWKLRIWESLESKTTTAQLGRAAAALGPGFRGNKVQLSAAQKQDAIRKLRAMYKAHDVAPDEMPSVLQNASMGIAYARMKKTAKKMMEAASTLPEPLKPLAEEFREDLDILAEAYSSGLVGAQADGTVSYETICAAICAAMSDLYKAMPMEDSYCKIIATFPDAFVYEHMNKLYQRGYIMQGTSATIEDTETEVTAGFTPVLGEGGMQEGADGQVLWEARPAGLLQDAQLDREARVIRGTVLITADSVNGVGGRKYTDKALRQIAQMSEGIPAYANHVAKDLAFKARPVEDLIGRHRNVRYDAAQHRVTSDLHLAEHQAPWVFSLVDELSDVVGNSLVSKGLVRMEGNTEIVEEILAVRSGDLVSDPGATRGLFEHREAWTDIHPIPTAKGEETTMEALKLKDIQEHLEKDAAHKAALKESLAGAELKSLTEAKASVEAENAKLKTELVESKAKVSAFEAASASRAKAAKLDKVLVESDLGKKFGKNPHAITDEFKALLSDTAEDKWAALIEDRAKLLAEVKTSIGPRSAGKDPAALVEGRDGLVPEGSHERLRRALLT